MNDNYLIEFDEIKELTIKELLDRIKKTKGKALNELKVKDLSYHNGNLITPGEGVYIFREKTEIVLVGKVSSMSFTERISKHFDYRPYAWFNRLLFLLCERHLKLEKSEQNFKLASKYAFDNLNIVLINFKSREKINRIERLLRSCTNTLNKFKHLKERNVEKIVNEY
jgi:hypothetical protein